MVKEEYLINAARSHVPEHRRDSLCIARIEVSLELFHLVLIAALSALLCALSAALSTSYQPAVESCFNGFAKGKPHRSVFVPNYVVVVEAPI